MRTIGCDTSFLFALYANNAHSARAVAFLRKRTEPLTISLFNEFEFKNALRFAGWRKLYSETETARFLRTFGSDLKSGLLVIAPLNLVEVLTEAQRLSTAYTQTGGYRSFDILHVAAALKCHASHFLTFDANQRRLALAVGLALNPGRDG